MTPQAAGAFSTAPLPNLRGGAIGRGCAKKQGERTGGGAECRWAVVKAGVRPALRVLGGFGKLDANMARRSKTTPSGFQVSLHEMLLLVVVCSLALAAVARLEATLWFKGFVAAYFTGLSVALLLIFRGLRQPKRPVPRHGRLRLGRRPDTSSSSRGVPWFGASRAFRLLVVVVYGYVYILAYLWILLLVFGRSSFPWSDLREFFSEGAVAGFSIRTAFYTIDALLIAYLVFDAVEYVCVRGVGSWKVWIAYAFALALAVSLGFAIPPAKTPLERAEEYACVEVDIISREHVRVEGREIPAEGLLGALEYREREIQARPIGPDHITVYLRPVREVPLHELHRTIMKLVEAGFDHIRLRGWDFGMPYEFRVESVRLRLDRREGHDEDGTMYLLQYPDERMKQLKQVMAIHRMVGSLLQKAWAGSQRVDITLCGGSDLTCQWLWTGLELVGTPCFYHEGRRLDRHVVFEVTERQEADSDGITTTVVHWVMVPIGPPGIKPPFP